MSVCKLEVVICFHLCSHITSFILLHFANGFLTTETYIHSFQGQLRNQGLDYKLGDIYGKVTVHISGQSLVLDRHQFQSVTLILPQHDSDLFQQSEAVFIL